MKIFVTGVNGQLGHDCVKELAGRGHAVTGSDIQDSCALDAPYIPLDITDGDAEKKTTVIPNRHGFKFRGYRPVALNLGFYFAE